MTRTAKHLAIRVSVGLVAIAAGLLGTPSLASNDRPIVSASVAPVAAKAPATVESPVNAEVASASTSAFDATAWSDAALAGIDADVFGLALTAAEAAIARGDATTSTLTVIDFSRPSTSRRMWVYDLRTRALLFKELVSHGRNSGDNLARSFSNREGSYKSSIGLFRAAEGYIGKHGYSLRLDGLEPGFNDRARARAIVVHGAEYVNGATARSQGRLGRSLGCPAVRPAVSRPLIDAVKEGGLVFAYYPDPAWLSASEYLN